MEWVGDYEEELYKVYAYSQLPTNQPTNQPTHDQPAFLHKSWGKICQIEKNWPKNLLIHGCLILTQPPHHPTSEKAPKGSTWRSCYEESCHNGGDWSMPPGPSVHSTHPPLRAMATWPSKPWGWAKALSQGVELWINGAEIPNNHLGWLKPYEEWEIHHPHHPWWCRILSINKYELWRYFVEQRVGLGFLCKNPTGLPNHHF